MGFEPVNDVPSSGLRYRMSAVLKSQSRPVIACQSRDAVIEVSVAPPIHGDSQLISAEMHLSFMSCLVGRLLYAPRSKGSSPVAPTAFPPTSALRMQAAVTTVV